MIYRINCRDTLIETKPSAACFCIFDTVLFAVFAIGKGTILVECYLYFTQALGEIDNLLVELCNLAFGKFVAQEGLPKLVEVIEIWVKWLWILILNSHVLTKSQFRQPL